ncbi:MAG: branched-chain amino acid ABC transporter permease [Saezia sp.]
MNKKPLFFLMLLAFMAWVWWGMSDYVLRFWSQALATMVILLSLRVLVGMGGVITFGHALYVGMGAYGAVYLMLWSEQLHVMVPLIFVPLAGGLAGFLTAVVAGWLSTRRTHAIYTAMMTLALCELMHVLAQIWFSVFGGEGGLQIDRTAGNFMGINFADGRWMVLLSLLYALLSFALVRVVAKSALGQWLKAVREDAERVSCLGASPRQIQYYAFLISGFLAGIGGALLLLEFELADSSMFSVAHSASYLIFAALGGLGSSLGSLIGAVLEVFSQIGLPILTSVPELYIGLAIILIVLFLPQGLVSMVSELGKRLGSKSKERADE